MHYEIKDTKRKTLENKVSMVLDIANIYLKYLVVFPMNANLRRQLLVATKGFFIHMKYENEILNRLDKAVISQEDFTRILNCLDDLYDEAFQYYDHVLDEFETTLSLKDFERIVYKDSSPRYLTEEKREELLCLIDSLENKSNHHL